MSGPIGNVLAGRYASPELRDLWSAEAKIIAERRLWVAVLRAQADLGVAVPAGVIEKYESVLENVDLGSIAARERRTLHDVKARIEEFAALAGERIHPPGDDVSRSDRERRAAAGDLVAAADPGPGGRDARAARDAGDGQHRSGDGGALAQRRRAGDHDGQAVRLGRRGAAAGIRAGRVPAGPVSAAGNQGPDGNGRGQLDLLGGDADRLATLEDRVAAHLGFTRVFDSVGQVYPRSLDYDVVSALVQLAAGPSSLATTIRLMAGQELATEGFREGQVGSSAMPHKMNSRSCERVNGLAVILRGYASMTGELAGNQWNEGDVFCSVVRRVALPDAFFAADGLFTTMLTVLDGFGAYPAVIAAELARYLPFLATPRFLVAGIRGGLGREQAHEIIKGHAVSVALAMRQHPAAGGGEVLLDRLAEDPRFPLDRAGAASPAG